MVKQITGYIEWHRGPEGRSGSIPEELFPTTWEHPTEQFYAPVDSVTYIGGESDRCLFGQLHLDVPEVPITPTPLALVVTLDRSGSMNEQCADGHTKMEHIQHMLKNMCALLAKYVEEHPGVSVRLCIVTFSHDVTSAFKTVLPVTQDMVVPPIHNEFVDVTPEHLDYIHAAVKHIDAWGLTNIEKALKHVQNIVGKYREEHPDHVVVHVQMTDGDATAGKLAAKDLGTLVPKGIRNVFLGVGDDHDSILLNYLSDLSVLGEYRFMDQLEKSGWVCGEILYNILYPYPVDAEHPQDTTVLLKTTPGTKIYDWYSNTWVTEIQIPYLSGGAKKDYHIYVESPYFPEDVVIALETSRGDLLNTVGVLPTLVDIQTGARCETDLTKFLLRQRVQECLYKVKQYEAKHLQRLQDRRMSFVDWWADSQSQPLDEVSAPDHATKKLAKGHLRAELKSLYQTLEYYQERTEEADGDFIQTLMDDVLVTMRTLGTRRGFMYSSARLTSQGNQYSYTPTGGGDGGDGDDPPTETNDVTLDLNLRRHHRYTSRNNTTTYIHSSVFSMMTQLQDGEVAPTCDRITA